MLPIKRPKAGDTEEDLLKEEKEFLESLKTRKVVPAATVVNKSVKKDPLSGSESDRGPGSSKRKDIGNGDEEEDDDNPMIEHAVEAVLFDIKERAFDPLKLKEFGSGSTKGIPQVLPNPKSVGKSNESSSGSGTRKKSLFARSFDARKAAREKVTSSQTSQTTKVCTTADISENEPQQSSRSEAIGDKIHPYLAGMTEEEILEEQRKLLERLDPKLVEFIKSRKHKSASGSDGTLSSQEPSKTSVPMEVDNSSISNQGQIEEKDLPINPKLVQQYPGMDKIELPKLEWAGVVKDGKGVEESKQVIGKSARFDFSGMLIPDQINDPTTYERALHNHGEEMERPGYTMEELLTLARSVNIQQRSIALETLGHVFSRAHTGLYDDLLEQSVFNLMDYMDLIHTVRKGLDNVDSNTINAALSCLASLLYPDVEEDCLDAVYLWPDARPHPLVSAVPDEIVNDRSGEKDLKDFEFLQLDLLEFLIFRSDILVRIEYLLTTKSDLFSEKGVTSLLKILIRLARHSPSSVMNYEKILKYVTVNYVSPNWITLSDKDKALKGIPLFQALKLVRILVESSISNAMKLYNSYSVLPSVMSYLAYDQWREQSHVKEVESLVLEAFKIWIGFLSFGIAIDEYLALFPVLMQMLTFYGLASDLNSFDLHHSSHLFALLTQILRFGDGDKRSRENKHSHWELVKDAASLIEKHCIKMLKILASPHLQGTYSIDLAVLSLGKGLEFLTCSLKYCDKDLMKQTFVSALTEFSRSNTYITLTSNLISHSSILAKSSTKTRYPSNYVPIGAVKWNGELHPMMRPNSPYHFLKHFIAHTRSLCGEDSLEIVCNSKIEAYLSALRANTSDCVDYFVRFELSCLFEILNTLPKNFSGKFVIAYNSLVFVPSCCTAIFRDLLRVALETCCNLNDVEAVYQFYVSYFLGASTLEPESVSDNAASSSKTTKVRFDDGGHPGDGAEDEPKVLFQKWTGKITEAHWVFHPLENLYKRATSTPGYVKENLSILEQETRGCLSFIQQCLQYHSESILQTSQDLVTVYCRICRVFMLGSPSVYIDAATMHVLGKILKILLNSRILKNSTDIIFSKHKPSSSAAVSFYDFYTELVNEYFDNSYFNEMFASYLILPLRSAEDETVKTCFWSHEYVSCVKVSNDKISVPVDYLTQTPEKDQKMLMIYTHLLKKKIISSDKNPLLYAIVTEHLKNSLEFMTDKIRHDFDSLCI